MKMLCSGREFSAPPFQGSFRSIPCPQGSRPGLCCATPAGFCNRDPWDFHGRARLSPSGFCSRNPCGFHGRAAHSPERAEQHSPGRKPISAKIIFLRPNICCMDPIFLGFSGSVRSPKSPYPAQIDLNLALMGSRPGLCCATPAGFCNRDPWDFHGRARLSPSGFCSRNPCGFHGRAAHSPERAEQHSPGRKPWVWGPEIVSPERAAQKRSNQLAPH